MKSFSVVREPAGRVNRPHITAGVNSQEGVWIATSFMRRDREAKARYGRELRRIGMWVAGFAALMAVLIGLR